LNLDLYTIVVSLPAIVIALTVHEFAHAWTANKLGDSTARYAGRLTLEPWAHLDPIGLLMIMFYRFGWAKPVPVDPRQMRDPARGMAMTALAGPLANLLLALAFGVLWASGIAGRTSPTVAEHLNSIIVNGVLINVGLFVFNLLPLPPLDGARLLAGFAPVERWPWWDTLNRYGPLMLLGLLVSGAGGFLIGVPANFVISLVVRFANAVVRLVG
jgi:Zn-dependent protease